MGSLIDLLIDSKTVGGSLVSTAVVLVLAILISLVVRFKVVVPANAELVNVIGELAGVVPVAPKSPATTTPVRKWGESRIGSVHIGQPFSV